jgi:hypothetical protein
MAAKAFTIVTLVQISRNVLNAVRLKDDVGTDETGEEHDLGGEKDPHPELLVVNSHARFGLYSA